MSTFLYPLHNYKTFVQIRKTVSHSKGTQKHARIIDTFATQSLAGNKKKMEKVCFVHATTAHTRDNLSFLCAQSGKWILNVFLKKLRDDHILSFENEEFIIFIKKKSKVA